MNKEQKSYIEGLFEYCIKRVDNGLEKYRGGFFPIEGENNIYRVCSNGGWTNGFWTGMVWLAYEMTKNEKYREAALDNVNSFYGRILNDFDTNHHDMGFEYSPSCVAAYKLTGSELAKKAALMAADALCRRFEPVGRFIKPWGDMSDPVENRIIVDTYLNLPLLFWASEVSGDDKYRKTALAHLETTVDILVREDGRAYHTYMMDLKYGNPIMPKVDQGYADDSVWSRGQAWVVYGLALAYGYTKDKHILEVQKKATDVFIKRLPRDNVPAWDMVFTDCRTLKDTSAAVIAACGMLEMNRKYPENPESGVWQEKVFDMIKALGSEHTTEGKNIEGTSILMHSTSSVRHNMGINESLPYGDYYYMETLYRLLNPEWRCYW